MFKAKTNLVVCLTSVQVPSTLWSDLQTFQQCTVFFGMDFGLVFSLLLPPPPPPSLSLFSLSLSLSLSLSSAVAFFTIIADIFFLSSPFVQEGVHDGRLYMKLFAMFVVLLIPLDILCQMNETVLVILYHPGR